MRVRGENRLSSVQFIRFPLTPAQRDALRKGGKLSVVCDAEPVVLFETCTVNYNRPEVGVAAVQVLEHNGKRIERPISSAAGCRRWTAATSRPRRRRSRTTSRSSRRSFAEA
ncbi:MAG TPA: hypothetical protein VH087_17305 [Thermoanaerobaculia bacterium]|nr:hypothetical protein [Thermoanaerobaculia bacterium]